MKNRLHRWLAPPVFEGQEERTWRAGLLNATIIVSILIVGLGIIGNLIGGRIQTNVYIIEGMMLIFLLLLRCLLFTNRVTLTGLLLIILGMILVTADIASLGTIRTPGLSAYLLMVIIAGMLFGLKGLVLCTLSSSLAVLGLILAENAGMLPDPDYYVNITQWITYSVLSGLIGSLTYFSYQSMHQALERKFKEIEERVRAEERLATSLKEKEVLLRETHHRVKNNMQVIVSLLGMHSRRTDDTRLNQVFDDCRNRINAMSLIHEALYQSDDFDRIDFEVYLKKLCRNLSRVHGASGKGIEVRVERCKVSLDMDQGIAVGMVISELVSNAFKHAFPLGKGGMVAITLFGLEGDEVELIVQDDGKGLSPEIDIFNPPSIGLRLTVATVTRELDGSIEVERNGGTRFVIRFKGKNAHSERRA